MANKEERIAGIIRKSISEIITMELKNPHLGFVTIPEVKVSKDFSYAKVYVSFMFEEQIEEGMKVLEKSKGFIRSGLAKRLDTRRCPELVFVLDESFKREARITELLNNIRLNLSFSSIKDNNIFNDSFTCHIFSPIIEPDISITQIKSALLFLSFSSG